MHDFRPAALELLEVLQWRHFGQYNHSRPELEKSELFAETGAAVKGKGLEYKVLASQLVRSQLRDRVYSNVSHVKRSDCDVEQTSVLACSFYDNPFVL